LNPVDLPIAFSALVFAGLALLFWRQSPVCARVVLAVATVFGIAALEYPGMTIEEVLRETREGLTYLVAIARVSGFAAAMLAVTAMVRRWAMR
jgi:hypothetical protein